jgi:hypothetical protein
MRALRRRRVMGALRGAALLVVGSACVGTTGGQLVTFPAAVAGAVDASPGSPFRFATDLGWNVVLTEATLHVGAVYLNQSAPVSGAQSTDCILPGTYVAQVTSGIDADLLSPDLQPFPGTGSGTTIPPALAGQVWLTGGDINTVSDPSPPTAILVITGTAVNGATTIPFTGRITIASNRQTSGSAAAGGDSICKERIVSPIATSVAVGTTGGLVLRIDPRQLFVNVNFALLAPSGNAFAFSDDPTSAAYTQPSRNLYQNLHSGGGLYTFEWDDDL